MPIKTTKNSLIHINKKSVTIRHIAKGKTYLNEKDKTDFTYNGTHSSSAKQKPQTKN